MSNLLIISGGSAGIGLETVKLFLQKKWSVINISRRECPEKDALSLSVDLTDANFLAKICDTLETHIQKAKKVCLIHNAALLEKDSLQTLNATDFRKILEINVIAPQVLNKFCIPILKSGSSVLYVGSTLAEKAVGGAFSYVTSKHAQLGMMRATCQDLIGKKVHTACICPGFTDTEMLNKHLNHDVEILKTISSMNAYDRLIKPKEIADVLYFSAMHPVINGAVLHSNLGQIER